MQQMPSSDTCLCLIDTTPLYEPKYVQIHVWQSMIEIFCRALGTGPASPAATRPILSQLTHSKNCLMHELR